jgi:putative spermidine/putrescine transport system substrate-binding protein
MVAPMMRLRRACPLRSIGTRTFNQSTTWSFPRGSKNVDIAHGLINEMTVAENQAKLANKIAYSPTNSDAFEGIDAKVAPWLATNPENAAKGFVIGADFWQDHLEKLTEEWEGWKLS